MNRTRRALVRGVFAVAAVLGGPSAALAFDPISGEEPLPKTAAEAEHYVREAAYFYLQEYPDSVRCALIHEGGQDVFECHATKAGQADQLVFVTKG